MIYIKTDLLAGDGNAPRRSEVQNSLARKCRNSSPPAEPEDLLRWFSDDDSQRMLLRLEEAKSRKDRYVT